MRRNSFSHVAYASRLQSLQRFGAIYERQGR